MQHNCCTLQLPSVNCFFRIQKRSDIPYYFVARQWSTFLRFLLVGKTSCSFSFYQKSSFCWVELNMMVFFLILENYLWGNVPYISRWREYHIMDATKLARKLHHLYLTMVNKNYFRKRSIFYSLFMLSFLALKYFVYRSLQRQKQQQ